MLDLGCGKGADMRKFDYERISGYVGVDVSLGQLIDALNRKLRSKHCRFPALFIKQKGQAEPAVFRRHLPEKHRFHVVSAQFCIHYFFESEASVRNFLQNVSSNLLRHGLFLATFPDSKVIAKKFQEMGQVTPEGQRVVGNEYYSILTAIPDFGRLRSAFGNQYGFFLADGLIGSQRKSPRGTERKHIPEFLVLSDHFVELAKEYDLEVVRDQNLHEFYHEHISDYFDLFQKIGFRWHSGESLMDEALWDVSYLYKAIVLRKTSGESMKRAHERFEENSFWEIKHDGEALYSEEDLGAN